MKYAETFDFAHSQDRIKFKITDFGLAKNLGNQTMAATFCGTALTMPPEQLKDCSYDH